MAQAKRQKAKGADGTDNTGNADDALRKVVEERLEAIRRINELRAPAWEALAAELDPKGRRKSFGPRAARLGRQMQKAFERYRAGELSRARAVSSYRRALADLRSDFEAQSVDALWKHAAAQPSFAEVLQAWRGAGTRDVRTRIVPDKYMGWLLEHAWELPSDVGTVEQGLGDDPAPPPLGICAAPPFAFHDDRTSSQGISIDNYATSTPASGRFAVNVFATLAGGSSAHSLVGADFTIPRGFTNISVTASIDWSYSGWTFAIGGAAGTGADLVLWIENPAGASPVQTSTGLYSLISPVIWGNSASGSGNSVIAASLATPDAASKTIRIFAGVSAHTEVFATVAADAQTIASGTVTRICISAT